MAGYAPTNQLQRPDPMGLGVNTMLGFSSDGPTVEEQLIDAEKKRKKDAQTFIDPAERASQSLLG